MATPLDGTILSQYGFIFIVILVYAVVYGILKFTKMFESEAVNQIIAIVLALITLMVPGLLDVIKFFGPWVVIVLFVLMMALLIMKFMGASDSDIAKFTTGNRTVAYILIAIFLILFIAALGKVYFAEGDFLEEDGSAVESISEGKAGDKESGEVSFWRTIFHPNVMGFILIMLIAVFTIITMSSK